MKLIRINWCLRCEHQILHEERFSGANSLVSLCLCVCVFVCAIFIRAVKSKGVKWTQEGSQSAEYFGYIMIEMRLCEREQEHEQFMRTNNDDVQSCWFLTYKSILFLWFPLSTCIMCVNQPMNQWMMAWLTILRNVFEWLAFDLCKVTRQNKNGPLILWRMEHKLHSSRLIEWVSLVVDSIIQYASILAKNAINFYRQPKDSERLFQLNVKKKCLSSYWEPQWLWDFHDRTCEQSQSFTVANGMHTQYTHIHISKGIRFVVQN